MKKEAILNIKQLLQSPKKMVIVPHKNPDGDAIGSTLGLYHYLKMHNQEAIIIAPNDYPDFLKWMPGENTILKYDAETGKCNDLISDADVIFTLDFNALNRTGDMELVLKSSSALKIMIDHHQQPDAYAAYMYSDVTMSSTCEMVYNFITMLDDKNLINQDIATCLYTGIMTDTGSFRFASTTSETHRVTAFLIDKGAQPAKIHNAVMDANSFDRMQLLGCALTNLKVIPESKTAYITLSQDELNTYNYKKGDTEGFVNYALSLQNIIFAVIFIEDKQNNIIKMSFRSKGDFSVNEFARAHFEGGGHTNAAGGKSNLSLPETVEKFISILPAYNNALKNE
ncbi:phosphoesterase RecJ domain-containing protein [Bizionia echini]|uniref:Phosphoesterase RecJ domain-containing protein n=1 Tax=Bizionia echini TaxID=649333 RepID=A0A1I5BEK7_9FLAO|nr:bifunctional oligoribonuclease/PAP phosphatase NrnA [Bizionia echini]SFN73173.1 phosphoesterase RecJ domain-containing protein [Bizionia echini]